MTDVTSGTPDVVKQIIVLRTDLAMPPGKSASQAAHASIRFLTERLRRCKGICYTEVAFSLPERLWMEGQFTKIVTRVKTEGEIYHLANAAREAGLQAHVIIDSGATVFDGVPTLTALAIGPDFSTKLDPVTGHLELY
jgi:PTH2 family peptidyl-tRNA hydrolase